ncbi:MAG: hypothetical protein WBA00_12865, partial [Rhodococcus sp. (in: high G+C Gram-positive bacteria)]
RRPRIAGAACITALILVLPDLAWGVGGALRPVHYPSDWAQVSARVGASDSMVAVLPTGTFRRFDFAGDAPVLDPAPRWLNADVLQTGDLPVGATAVRGEGGTARRVEALLLSGAPADELAALGVGWILVERSAGPRGDSARTLADLDPAYRGSALTLYALPDPVVVDSGSGRGPVIAAHLLWAATLLGSGMAAVSTGVRRVRPR